MMLQEQRGRSMGERWVKLFVKIGDHEIMADHTALAVFIYLLTHVNQNGEIRITRNNTCTALDMRPSTFRDALYRLIHTYIVATGSPTGRYTLIKLIHWDKYQVKNIPPTGLTTGRRQDDDRTYIYKNKNKNKEIYKERENNPIISDPIFTRLQSVYKPQTDGEIRQKMDLESKLANKYSDFRYQNYWNEARAILKGLN